MRGLAHVALVSALLAGCPEAHRASEDPSSELDAPLPIDAGVDAPVRDAGMDVREAPLDAPAPSPDAPRAPHDAAFDADLGEPEWRFVPSSSDCLDVARHPERVAPLGTVTQLVAIDGELYAVVEPWGTRITALASARSGAVVAAWRTAAPGSITCAIDDVAGIGGDVAVLVERISSTRVGYGEIWRGRLDDLAATTAIQAFHTDLGEGLGRAQLVLGPSRAAVRDETGAIYVHRPGGTTTALVGWDTTTPGPTAVGDALVFVSGSLGPYALAVSEDTSPARTIRPLSDGEIALASDGATLAWCEDGRLLRATWDGALHVTDVGPVECSAFEASVGGGHYGRLEQRADGCVLAVRRLSDGALATAPAGPMGVRPLFALGRDGVAWTDVDDAWISDVLYVSYADLTFR